MLPDPLALDTSFVVEALLATQPLHPACSALLTRIDESGVRVVTSDLLVVELAEATFANALKERWAGKWRTHRTDGRSRRAGARKLNHTIARYDALLSSVNQFSIPMRRVSAPARALMIDYGLASYDAVHAAPPSPPAPRRSSRSTPASRCCPQASSRSTPTARDLRPAGRSDPGEPGHPELRDRGPAQAHHEVLLNQPAEVDWSVGYSFLLQKKTQHASLSAIRRRTRETETFLTSRRSAGGLSPSAGRGATSRCSGLRLGA